MCFIARLQIELLPPRRADPKPVLLLVRGSLKLDLEGLSAHVLLRMAYMLWLQDMCGKVTCLAAVGPRLWAGMADGRIRVVADKAVTREFRAHDAGILRITPAGSRVYSLAADGSVRGWCSTIPSEQDQASRSVA